MSAAKTPIKVLRTALKRVEKGWTKGSWGTKGDDGQMRVCLEGAIFGFCNAPQTQQQAEALLVVQKILREKILAGEVSLNAYADFSIPAFNDAKDTTLDQVVEIIKLGIIRLETTDDLEEALANEVDSLLEFGY